MPAPFATPIDLRPLAPPARHALIFNSLAALLPGQSLQLINDHDPQPLHEQLQLRAPGLFNWHALDQGPQVWRVQISRNAQAASAETSSCCSGGACCG